MDERSDTATDSPLCQLISYNGERWIVDAITNNGDHALLNLLGNAGVVVRVPVEEIREIVMSKPESQTASPELVCWICGYSSKELREMVEPGKCEIARQWEKPRDRCYANHPDFEAEVANGK